MQRVTAKKLHPFVAEGEMPLASSEFASEWNKVSDGEEDKTLVDHLNHLTGVCSGPCMDKHEASPL